MLHGKEQSYGIALVNVTDQVLSVNDFPSWSLVPGRSWTDSPHNVNLPPHGRVTSWTIREPSGEKSIELNWKILDWQDGGAKTKVIRAAQQILALPDFEKIRRANELYTINLVWDGSSFQLTYTVVRDGSLVDVLPDMSVVPKGMMESPRKIRGYHERE
ncbi:hypothetical protein SDC9_195135 [bioreactor metagenome]|uniref:Uncharacterized protein n=1 Tax=bioreactor metagenome TaxID=1076179 RepID=A0A645I9Q0_9ZZZZ